MLKSTDLTGLFRPECQALSSRWTTKMHQTCADVYMSEDRDSDLLKAMAVMATRAEKGELPQETAGGVAPYLPDLWRRQPTLRTSRRPAPDTRAASRSACR